VPGEYCPGEFSINDGHGHKLIGTAQRLVRGAWLFGTVKTDANGHKYTNTIGTKHYVMQEMLELASKSRNGNIPGVCKNTF